MRDIDKSNGQISKEYNSNKLIKIRNLKRVTLTRRLADLPIEEIEEIISRIEIVTCLMCDLPFVSDDKTKIRRCNNCGRKIHASPIEGDAHLFSPSNRRRASI